VTRRPASPDIPLTRVALLAGEAFGHHSAEATLSESTYGGQARSALALVLIVCLMTAVYLAI
jgi:hypothetical protein